MNIDLNVVGRTPAPAMTDQTFRSKFEVSGFQVEDFVAKEFKVKAEDQMKQYKDTIQEEKEKTADELKRNVLDNYPQFIDASKEIANMEGDLMELRNMLLEMKKVMKSLKDISLSNVSRGSVEGQADLFSEYPSRDRRQMLLEEVHWALGSLYDLDVLIAERRFDEAVQLIEETKNGMDDLEQQLVIDRVRAGLDSRASQLADRLCEELHNPIVRTVQRARIVAHLRGLGKLETARDIFFTTQSKWINHMIRNIKFEGDTISYANELTRLVVSMLCTTADDFQSAFKEPHMTSSFVVWVVKELKIFADIFNRQVFHSDDFRTIATCLDITYTQLKHLEEKGLSVEVIVRQCFRPLLTQSIEAYCERLERSLAKWVENEKWRGRELIIQDSKDSEKKNVSAKLTDSAKFLYVSANRMVADVGRILTPDLYLVMNNILGHLFDTYFASLSHAAYSGILTDAQSLSIVANAYFVAEDLLPRLSQQFQKKFGRPMHALLRTHDQIAATHEGLCDSYASERAQMLVREQIQWSDKVYGDNQRLEKVLHTMNEKKELKEGQDGGIEILPSFQFVNLIEFLSKFVLSINNHIGPNAVDGMVATVAEEIAGDLDDEEFWKKNSELSLFGLHALVTDMRFFLAALGHFASDICIEFVEALIGRGVVTYCKAHGADPRTALAPDFWFNLMAQRQLANMQATLHDPLPDAPPTLSRDEPSVKAAGKDPA